MSTTPLAGIRVLDLTSVVVGPACTQRLADYGAEVIKVEARVGGDVYRILAGPSPSGKQGGGYLHLNRKKRNVCLDLKQPGGRNALMLLVARSDVFVSNMRPEALVRLQLDPASLRANQPGLVHCTITGYGPKGPYSGKPAYDSVIQGASGAAGLMLARDGVPAYVPLMLCDHVTGEIAAGAILAALFERKGTGVGSSIEVPMHETMAAFILAEHMGARSFDPAIGPAGDARLLNPDNRPLQTADGWISMTANTDAQVIAFLSAAGRTELLEDSRFCTMADRGRNLADWYAVRAQALLSRSTADWLEILAAADVPAAPCHTLETLMDDPHLRAVALIEPGQHPTEGNIKMIRPSILYDGNTATPGTPASPTGYDTAAVLAEAGLTSEEIEHLRQQGAAT